MTEGRSSSRVTGGAAPPPASERDRIVDAMLHLVAQDGWRHLSMAAIAAEADLPIVQLYRAFSSKTAILCGFARRVDEEVLAAPLDIADDERPRDRVFDLLMRRFDALRRHREALDVLRRELPSDPHAALAAGAAMLHSIAWMLEGAGISAQGFGGVITVNLTAAAYAATMRVWLRDDSPDLASTMATLDRRLRGIERWFGRSARPSPRATAAEA